MQPTGVPASPARAPYIPATTASTPGRNALWNVLPLLLSVAAGSFIFWGPWTVPTLLAVSTTLFFVYWLFRSYMVVIGAFVGRRKMHRWARTDWTAEYAGWQAANPGAHDAWNWPRHLVVIPNYRESETLLRRTLDGLAAQENRNQLVVVLAMEMRDPTAAQRADHLLAAYQGTFARLFATYHPADLPGELAGKGSNEAWAVRRAHELLIEDGGDDIRRYTVTSCDADALFHPRHFSALNYKFLTADRRHRTFWQPVIFYSNNIWDIPAVLRIPNGLSGLNRLSALGMGTAATMPMSCYSLSWSMLHEADYWDEEIISEDWHIYLKCAFSLGDEVSLDPILLPLGNDCVYAPGTRETLKGQYLQYQRHAFGAQDVPYALRAMLDRRSPLSLPGKVGLSWLVTKSHMLWVAQWFLLTLGWHLPATLAQHTSAEMPAWWTTRFVTLPALSLYPGEAAAGDFSAAIGTTMAFSLPMLLFYLTLPPLLVVIAQEYRTRGPRPAHVSRARAFAGLAAWPLLPVLSFVYGALPALDAQWQLASGRKFAFRVAQKGNRALPQDAVAHARQGVTLADR